MTMNDYLLDACTEQSDEERAMLMHAACCWVPRRFAMAWHLYWVHAQTHTDTTATHGHGWIMDPSDQVEAVQVFLSAGNATQAETGGSTQLCTGWW